MTAKTRYFVISSALVTFVGIGSGLVAYYAGLPARAFATRGGPEELQYIPHDATLVAYADVRHIMASELRQRIKTAMATRDPGKELGRENAQHEFEAQTGINIETDIDHVVACLQADSPGATGRGAGLVIASGTFNEVKIESLMREHGAQIEQYKDKRLIVGPVRGGSSNLDPSSSTAVGRPHPELAVAFLKSGLVAIGTSALVRRAIDLGNGGDNMTTNEEVLSQIQSLDTGDAWVVGRLDALRATANLPRGLGQLPPITWFSATGTVNDGIQGVVRAETSSDEAAKNLRDVIQGFAALANLQAGAQPELKALVQSLEISGTGKTVGLSFSIPGRIVDVLAPDVKARSRQAH